MAQCGSEEAPRGSEEVGKDRFARALSRRARTGSPDMVAAPERLADMKRTGLVVLALANLAMGWARDHATKRADSPACLPATLTHSARLTAAAVDVSPAPETDTASPYTQVSFLGAPAAQIHDISVTGSQSGAHSGRLQGYSQGDGASFLPAAPFRSGESVDVRAAIGQGTAARQISF